MASKALVLLGLFAVLLVVSEVAAASRRELGTVKPAEGTVRPDQQGYGNPPARGYGTPARGYGTPARGYGTPPARGGGYYCSYGCCYRGYGGCSRCCSYAGEAVQTQPGH